MPAKKYTLLCQMSGGDAASVEYGALTLTKTRIQELRYLRQVFEAACDRLESVEDLYRLELHAGPFPSPDWYQRLRDDACTVVFMGGWLVKPPEIRLRAKDVTEIVDCEYVSVCKEGIYWTCRDHALVGTDQDADLETPMITWAAFEQMFAGQSPHELDKL